MEDKILIWLDDIRDPLKNPSVSDEEKADELREGERKIKDFEYCSNCLTIEVCRHARECKIQTKE